MTKLISIVNSLSNGRFHSGQKLAVDLNVSRTAVWKILRKIQKNGD